MKFSNIEWLKNLHGTILGSIFPCFDDENLRNPMAEKYSWKTLGSISPCFDDEILKIEWPKNLLRKNGQHFSPGSRMKISKIEWLIKIGQHFQNFSCFDDEVLKSKVRNIFLEKMGSIFPCFDDEVLKIKWPKNLLRTNWAAFSPALRTRISKTEWLKNRHRKIGQHFPLPLL